MNTVMRFDARVERAGRGPAHRFGKFLAPADFVLPA